MHERVCVCVCVCVCVWKRESLVVEYGILGHNERDEDVWVLAMNFWLGLGE